MSDRKNKKGNKANAPSKEEASIALNAIKEIQEVNNDLNIKNKIEEDAAKEKQRQFEIEQAKIAEVQERVNRKLRENLAKKIKKEKFDLTITLMESGKKIKWKSQNNGSILKGFHDNKLIFEIKRGLNLFNLYLKQEITIKEKIIENGATILKDKKMKPSYIGCSMNLEKLKRKSEKLI